MISCLWNREGSGPFLHIDVFCCASSSAEVFAKKLKEWVIKCGECHGKITLLY